MDGWHQFQMDRKAGRMAEQELQAAQEAEDRRWGTEYPEQYEEGRELMEPSVTRIPTDDDYPAAGSHRWFLGLLAGDARRKLADATFCRLENGNVVIKLHQTDVMKISPSNMIWLNTGGFLTQQTRKCINTYLPKGIRLYIEAGAWFLQARNGHFKYQDGIVLDEAGRALNAVRTTEKAPEAGKGGDCG